MKKISVIIPFYSNLEWLYEAVESVLAQTYPIHEIIIINDGSKEDMKAFLAKYGEKIKYIYQENAGPGAARNNGIRNATGDYIAFEDSDDIWMPTKIEKQVCFMIQSGAKWSHTGFYYWWPKTGKLKMVNSGRDYDDIRIQRMISTKIATPAVMLDANIYKDGDFYFPTNIRNGEDGALYTMLAGHYPLALVQEPLVKVRMRGTNSQSHAIERFNLTADSMKKRRLIGENIPFAVSLIKGFYCFYAWLFGKKSTPVKEFLAKCCWTIPYFLERIYVRWVYFRSKKNEKFILRYKAPKS